MKVQIYGLKELSSYQFVVILARYKDAWIFCKHKERRTWEVPGGHIEANEKPLDAAKRELREETGALEFTIKPIFDYSVSMETALSKGMAFYAEVSELGKLPPDFEMEKIALFTKIPQKLTYPQVQPLLIEHWHKLKLIGKI